MQRISRFVLLFIILLSVEYRHAESAFERLPFVPYLTARGGATVGWPEGNCAFLSNPAAEISSRAILSAAYSQPYGIDDFSEGFLSYNQTVANYTSVGLAWQRLSTVGYHEDRRSVALSWGNQIGRAGIRLDGFSIGIDGFGDQNALGVGVGGVLKLRKNLRIGVALNPVNRPKIPHALPRSWEMGIGLRARPELLFVADLRKADDSAAQIRAGSELRVGQYFVLRAGMHNQPWEATTGWGLQIGSLIIDYAWVNHSSLDGTHQIAISWAFQETVAFTIQYSRGFGTFC